MKLQKNTKQKLFAFTVLLALCLTMAVQTNSNAQAELPPPCSVKVSEIVRIDYQPTANMDQTCRNCKVEASPITDSNNSVIGMHYEISDDFVTLTINGCVLASFPGRSCRTTSVVGGAGGENCPASYDHYFSSGTGGGGTGTGGR